MVIMIGMVKVIIMVLTLADIMIGMVKMIIMVSTMADCDVDGINLQTSQGALENLGEVEHDKDLLALGVLRPLVLLPLVDPVEGHLLGGLSLVTLHLQERIGNQKQSIPRTRTRTRNRTRTRTRSRTRTRTRTISMSRSTSNKKSCEQLAW